MRKGSQPKSPAPAQITCPNKPSTCKFGVPTNCIQGCAFSLYFRGNSRRCLQAGASVAPHGWWLQEVPLVGALLPQWEMKLMAAWFHLIGWHPGHTGVFVFLLVIVPSNMLVYFRFRSGTWVVFPPSLIILNSLGWMPYCWWKKSCAT